MNYYTGVFKKYADFNGRARRTEYWMFTLFNVIVAAVLGLVGFAIFRSPVGLVFVVLYFLAAFLPSLAVTVRRLHDTGRSGAWYFITFVPYVGGIILIVLCCLDSQIGPNQYGPNPKDMNGFPGQWPGYYDPNQPYGQPPMGYGPPQPGYYPQQGSHQQGYPQGGWNPQQGPGQPQAPGYPQPPGYPQDYNPNQPR